ncbi:LysR family transcriptional regulator [Billgrantia antri]|uniref:LysR family transcriptional regulator n=1 Tax=Halomonas sulfidivorans TaxID=2733488 RepID=A0ABX7WBP7_9GAMM|nr:LysR family transcriptional regulator [Halomonas sulfidivorans]QTP57818.1 LysR family transcriptional regulator [Halomonas sulfidivorans]
MDIHQIKTFLAVAREGSITRASDLLYLSQPAVSAHIKAMEETLGLTLFERTPRGMQLTPAGQRLLAKAEQTLLAQRELIDEATRLKGSLTGELRLGASHIDARIVAGLLSRLAERVPEVEISLRYGTSVEILKGIRNGQLDAGFYNEAGAPGTDLATLEVSRFTTYLAARPGLVPASRPLDWQRLAELPWILPTSTTCCGQTAEALFDKHRIRPQRVISIDRESVTSTLISGGVGVGLLHADSAAAAQKSGEVELLSEAHSVRVLFAHLAQRAEEPLLRCACSLLIETPTV